MAVIPKGEKAPRLQTVLEYFELEMLDLWIGTLAPHLDTLTDDICHIGVQLEQEMQVRSLLYGQVYDFPICAHMMGTPESPTAWKGCRFCNIKLVALLVETEEGVVENKKLRHFAVGKVGEPRTQQQMLEIAGRIQECNDSGDSKGADRMKQETGVNGPPAFTQLVYTNAVRDCRAESLHLIEQGVEKMVRQGLNPTCILTL